MVIIKDLVSVVVPVYNQERFIGRCLRSILGQTNNSIEVIVVNDGSTDNSERIISNIASRDKRVVLVNQRNSGEAAARKKGYSCAKGEFIMFVDHDDRLSKDAISTLFDHIVNKNVDIVCGQAQRKFMWWTKPTGRYPDFMNNRVIGQPELFDNLYVSFFGINLFPVTLWGKIYRRSVIDKAMENVDLFMTPHLHFGGDEAFNLLLFPFINKVFFSDMPVYEYRWGGLTSGYNQHLPELLDFADFRIRLLDQYGYTSGYQPLFIEAVNVMISHLVQGISYRKMDLATSRAWIETECSSRYLVERMRSYYSDSGKSIPEKCSLVCSSDYDAIIKLAYDRIRKNRFSLAVKRLVKVC